MTDGIGNFVNPVRKSQLIRVLLIGFLVLLLQIPIAMIQGLIGERQTTRQQAVEEVTGKWGRAQNLVGPAVSVPYVKHWTEETEPGKIRARAAVVHATFLPESLKIDSKIESQVRSRGIFEVPVYRISIDVKGRFRRPDFSDWGVLGQDVLWDRAQMWFRISDARAIQNQATLTWNGRQLPFSPGTGNFAGTTPGIHAEMKGLLLGADGYDFSFRLMLNGSVGAYFAPFGGDTTVTVSSNWSDPSFQGNWLPSTRKVTNSGFTAEWKIPFLGRNYPQRWTSDWDSTKVVDESKFGVDLMSPVDPYRMSQRSVKYEALFLLLTFLSLWLFEVLVQHRLHSLQYLLVGAGMCLFYLLHLSLSEQLGFLAAYTLASASVVALITAYCAAILKRTQRAFVVGALLSGLYAYLYILLKNQDYALVIGSVALFLILAMVMYLTREVDWHSVGR